MTSRLFNLLCIYLGSLTVSYAQVENVPVKESTVFIKKIEISGKEIPLDSIIQTDYFQNNLKVFLGGKFSFTTNFRYRLFNPGIANSKYSIWKPISGSEINIYDLPSGRYDFQFMNLLRDKGASKTAFSLIILKPWYRTWWFWALAFICLFSLLYGREKFLKSQEEEEKEQQKKIIGLELRTLQLQMNPHFIFNALNSIQSYIISQDTINANSYLSKFAHLIRMFLDSSRNRYISISEEIKLLELYVEMENLRFQNQFDYQINIENTIDIMIEIPTMILQPFVENAINHGLRYKKDKGKLEVNFIDDNEYVTCIVNDNGVGRKKSLEIQKNSNKGYKSQGLIITEERLKTYNKLNNTDIQFSVKDAFPSDSNEDIGTIVIIKFPKYME